MSGIESIMNRDVVTIGVDRTVRDAATLMREHSLGALVVVKDGKIHGVLSERDVLNRVVAGGLDPSTVKVSEVCTTEPVTVEAQEPVEACYRLLREQGFRHLPIRNENNEAVGIVSSRDFMWGVLMSAENDVDIEKLCKKLGRLERLIDAAKGIRYDTA